MKKKIDFSNPFNGRRWLLLLSPDRLLGMTFKPNLNLKKARLGFSFKSNEFGLRGPNNVLANNVICGTSFAMGLSVDNDKNWYDLGDFGNCFNIGMPVGTINHLNLLDKYYKGNYTSIIYLYHPNHWLISKNFKGAKNANLDIFKHMRWKTSYASIVLLSLKLFLKKNILKTSKKKLTSNYKNVNYRLDTTYSYFNINKNKKELNESLNDLNLLFSRFENVYIFRVPIKEQIALKRSKNSELEKLNKNYNHLWSRFCDSIDSNYKTIDLTEKFNMDAFLQYDTHWSEKGNEIFFQELEKNCYVR